jgi:hypothetical protein
MRSADAVSVRPKIESEQVLPAVLARDSTPITMGAPAASEAGS